MIESTFTRSVHTKLPKEVYHWKISDRFTAGVPDAYYSGDKCDLWIEYKWINTLPKKLVTPKLSKLQLEWLEDRRAQGRNVAVIVGSPKGHLIFLDGEWVQGKAPTELYTTREIANWITNTVQDT